MWVQKLKNFSAGSPRPGRSASFDRVMGEPKNAWRASPRGCEKVKGPTSHGPDTIWGTVWAEFCAQGISAAATMSVEAVASLFIIIAVLFIMAVAAEVFVDTVMRPRSLFVTLLASTVVTGIITTITFEKINTRVLE